MTKVLVVATSRKTRGGITSVVKAHEQGEQWMSFHCRWVETHRDGSIFVKFWKLMTGLCEYLFFLPWCDLVHIHMSEPPSAFRKSVFFMPLARLFCKKTIVHFHAFSPETTIRSRYRCFYNYLFTKADRVIVLSNYWKDEVEKEFPKAKVEVVYNPCQEISNSEKIVKKKKQILYAGTVNQRKGYADMVRAFALIAKKYPEWSIVFAGNGEIENGKELAQELNISNQVKWLGWVSGEDKDKAFRESMVFCLPSYAEGFPMSVLDAWAYGIPVITTPVGGIPDVAIDGENMLLFTPGDTNALASCMERMISDDGLRERISKASIKFANEDFNMNTINRQIGETYKDTLKGWLAEKAYMAVALPLYAVLDKFGVKDDRRAEDENEIYIDYIKHYGWLRPYTTVSLEQIIPYADWKKARKLTESGHTEELYVLLDSWVKERQLNLNFPFIRNNNIKVTSSLPNEIILPWLKKWEIG